jgi:hypothetical protein
VELRGITNGGVVMNEKGDDDKTTGVVEGVDEIEPWGDPLGVKDGKSDWTSEGMAVGLNDGKSVGTSDGIVLGGADGNVVTKLGSHDGFCGGMVSVADGENDATGCAVTCEKPIPVGKNVGGSVGAFETP